MCDIVYTLLIRKKLSFQRTEIIRKLFLSKKQLIPKEGLIDQ